MPRRRAHVPIGLTAPALLLLAAACSGDSPPAGGETAPTSAPPAQASPAAESSPGGLEDEARARGVTYTNVSGTAEKGLILEANGAGVALLDLGADGDLDIVFAQGCASLEELLRSGGAQLALYENDGAGKFRALPAPPERAWWTGLAVGDVDADGDDDLVAAGYGELMLFEQKDGQLAARAANGLHPDADLAPARRGERGHPPAWATSLALFDADRDGHLDLYVGQYLDLDPLDPPRGKLGEGALAVPCRWKGHDVFCGPAGLVPQLDRFLRGRGDGTFEDQSTTALPERVAGFALGVLPFDADNDGDTDLFVANDSRPNLLLINDGKGAFRDVGRPAGVALSADGRMQAGMGVATADVDRDGLLDFAVTNFSDEPTELYFGSNVGFRRMTHAYGLLRETRSLLSWGVHLVDFDGDGWIELLSANGHVYPQADREHTGTRYGQRATLWKLGPERKAVPVAPRGSASILAPAIGARGSAVGDLDGDGAPDVVLARIDAPAAVGMNRLDPTANRVAVRLLGPELTTGAMPRTPRDGHGARAVLVVGIREDEHALLSECQTAAGFQSASTPWLHFGLGRETTYKKLIVQWPSGRIEELPGGEAGVRLTVREGQGLVMRQGLR